MAVIFSRKQLDEIKGALDGVKSVGQAWAAIESTQKLANEVAEELNRGFIVDSWRKQARKDVFDYQARLQKESRALLGAGPKASAATQWKSIVPAVRMLWSYCMVVQGQFPPNEEAQKDAMGAVMGAAGLGFLRDLRNAPSVLIEETAKVAKKAVKATGEIAKELTGAAAGAVNAAIPWKLIGLAAGTLVLVTGLLVVLTKSGALGQAVKLRGG
jgi:hypothetical protein